MDVDLVWHTLKHDLGALREVPLRGLPLVRQSG
jgi:hypothetical protein